MAYEALNNAASLKTNFIIVLNDNHITPFQERGRHVSISRLRLRISTPEKKSVTNALQTVPVVGDRMIEQIRKTKNSIKQLVVPGMLFEDMGITYLGPFPDIIFPFCVGLSGRRRKWRGRCFSM